MTAARTPPRPYRFTREQYFQLGRMGYFDGKRVERIRGEIIEMSPVGWPHVVGAKNTADLLAEVFKGVAWINQGNPIPTVDSDPQPDVMVVPGRIQDYSDHPTTALLIVEVADATLDRDTTVKAEVYATAGVADYWVLDLANRQLIVFRDPQPIPDGGKAYRERRAFLPDDSIAPLAAPAAWVRVADLLPGIATTPA